MRAVLSLALALVVIACTEKPSPAPSASASVTASATPSATPSAKPSVVASTPPPDGAPPVVVHGECTIKSTKTTVPVQNLDATLAKLQPELRVVYERALAKNPSIAGTAHFGAIIDVDGSFQAVVARGPEMPEKFVQDLSGVLRRAQLERSNSRGRAVEIRGTIVCAPAKG